MKPAAIGTALLLHTAAIGALMHVGAGQHHAQSGRQPLEVMMLPSSPAPSSSAITANPGAEATASTPLAETRRRDRYQPANRANTPPPETVVAGDAASLAPFATSVTPTARTGVSIPASYAASNVKPAYPLLSRRQEEQGTVLLGILVRADGTAGDVRLRKSSGYPLLDESALAAVRHWRFHPASINGQPMAEWYQVAIPFKLQN